MIRGACHCGVVGFELSTGIAAADIHCRQCSCDYCRRAGARWWSDPAGTVRFIGRKPSAYRFGSKTADFLFCPDCGQLLAAACETSGRRYAVVNLNNAADLDAARLPLARHEFQSEDAAARLARRERTWTPVK